MTIKQLEYFLEIANMGSITKAAKILNISQPPLSFQLKLLEDELGAELFFRNNKKLEITQEGLILKERAKVILALVNETIHDIKDVSEQKTTVLRIGSIGSVNNRLLPKIIAKYSKEYPYVKFNVFEGRTETLIDELNAQNIDLCFVRQPFNSFMLRSINVNLPGLKENEPDYFVTIALPHFYGNFFDGGALASISLDELKGKPLVIHQRYYDMLTNACHKRGFTPNIICENGEIQSSLSWAKEGIGIAIAPFTSALLNQDPTLVIKRLELFSLSPQVCLVWNASFPLSAETKAFISMI